jgi:hypothetical protein
VRAVTVGIEADGIAEVRGPALRPGAHIVIEGHYGLPDSTHVRVTPP